jgi:hypothetical protein
MAIPQTTLSAAIADGVVTTCAVRDALGFASSAEADDLVQIDSELLLVTGGLGTTSWSSISRGYASTTAAAHSNGATVSRIERGYTDLTRIKTQISIPASDVVDDTVLPAYVAATNAWMSFRCGVLIGPALDTTRTFDGRDATLGGTRLRIVGGIRSLSSLQVKPPGGSLETVTLTDVRLGPKGWEHRPGMPYAYIEFLDFVTGSWSSFPLGMENVVAVGTFGYATIPADLAKLADKLVVRMWESRNAGELASPTPAVFVNDREDRMLMAYQFENRTWRGT